MKVMKVFFSRNLLFLMFSVLYISCGNNNISIDENNATVTSVDNNIICELRLLVHPSSDVNTIECYRIERKSGVKGVTSLNLNCVDSAYVIYDASINLTSKPEPLELMLRKPSKIFKSAIFEEENTISNKDFKLYPNRVYELCHSMSEPDAAPCTIYFYTDSSANVHIISEKEYGERIYGK